MLTNRWTVLALLFTVRTGMGFQFQSVPALSPLFLADFAISVAELGLLIGLYHAPGIALALPGGALGQRYGDKRLVLMGLALMAAGALIMAFVPLWSAQLAGRFVSGIGGVLLNVLMTKMAADWFAGREMATAMGIFANAWPVGIALALVTLPTIATSGGRMAVMTVVTIFVVLGFVALMIAYRSPQIASASAPPAGGPPSAAWPSGAVLGATLCAGFVWGFYNAGLGVIFGFGPLMLTEQGWSATSASSATSIVLWLVALSVPLGGIIADRTGKRDAVMVISITIFAVLLVFAARTDKVFAALVALGLVSGLAAGPILSLPAGVLSPAARAIGMGLFFTMFYLVQLVGPSLAGAIARYAGSARTTFDVGAGFLVLALVSFVVFRVLAGRALEALSAPPVPSKVA